jgi:tetratricopeptide (TPR) repeat protein
MPIIVSTLFLNVSIVIAQSASWSNLNAQAKSAYDKGDLKTAAKFFREALDEARKSGKRDPELAMSLNNLGNLYCAQDKYSDAQPLLQEALTVLKGLVGANDINLASALNNLANCYNGQGNLKDAEATYKSALAINEKSTDPKRSLLTTLNGLTSVLLFAHRLAEAKTYSQQALSFVEKHPEQEPRARAGVYSQRASILMESGDFKSAEPILQKAIALDDKVFGKSSPQYAADMSNLAALKQRQGKKEEASTLYQQSLKTGSTSDTNPGGKISSLVNLANLAETQHQPDKAIEYLKQATALAEQTSGPDDPDLIELKNSLAAVYIEQGQYDDAVKTLYAAITAAQDMQNPPLEAIATGCNNVGNALFKQKKFDEAEMMLQRCVDTREKLNGPNSPATGLALSNLATVYGANEKYSDAEPLFKRAIGILEKSPDAKGDLKTCYQNYAGMLQASGKEDDARQLAARADQI